MFFFYLEVAQFFQRNTNKAWTKFCLITEQAADHSILLTVFEIEPFRVGMLACKRDNMNLHPYSFERHRNKVRMLSHQPGFMIACFPIPIETFLANAVKLIRR